MNAARALCAALPLCLALRGVAHASREAQLAKLLAEPGVAPR